MLTFSVCTLLCSELCSAGGACVQAGTVQIQQSYCRLPLHSLTQMKCIFCIGFCLEELCQTAIACPDTVTPLICKVLETIPGLSLSSHGLLDLQQQLPLKAVGACLLLPSEVTGELPQQRIWRGCLACNAAERLCAIPKHVIIKAMPDLLLSQ